jgi:hypothetical protein
MFIAVRLPQRDGINQINVPFHQFGEGIFGIGFGKLPEQFGIGRHFSTYSTRKIEKRTRKIAFDAVIVARQSFKNGK